MTLVMPDVDLSTILTEDLAPPCDLDCDATATWSAVITNTVCGCVFRYLICNTHKDEALQCMADPTSNPWVCISCGTKWGPNAYADDMILELEKL